MFNRALLIIIVLAVSVSMTAAKDQQKKDECPTLNLGEIEELVRKAPHADALSLCLNYASWAPAATFALELRSPKNARQTFSAD